MSVRGTGHACTSRNAGCLLKGSIRRLKHHTDSLPWDYMGVLGVNLGLKALKRSICGTLRVPVHALADPGTTLQEM